MAPQLGLKKISSEGEEDLGKDGSNDVKVEVDSEKVNGETARHENGDGSSNEQPDQAAKTSPIEEVPDEEGSDDKPDAAKIPSLDEPKPIPQLMSSNEQKPSASTEEDSTSDPAPKEMVHNETSKEEEAGDLGSLLKGSAFEPSPTEKQVSAPSEATQKPEAKKIVKRGKSPYDKSKALHPSKLAPNKGKPTSLRPAAISTSQANAASKGPPKPSPGAPTAKSPTTPQAPKSPVTPKRQPLSKTSSPRQQPESPKETSKPPLRKPSRTSLAPPTNKAPAAKPRQPPPTSSRNAPKVTSKASPEAKVRPRSPTRPVRLPAAATAPTASSAAKLGGPAPARSPSRASTSNLARKPSTLKKDVKPTTSRFGAPLASNLQRKSSRPSLPAQNGHERPKSRVSNVGSKAPDEGFLARMMRPTASSANKTHEKVEPKTPPKKTSAIKLKKRGESAEVEDLSKKGHVSHEQVHEQNGVSDVDESTVPEHQDEQHEEPVDEAAGLTNGIEA